MKNTFCSVIALVTLVLISKSAFAMHAYGTDDCYATTLSGQMLKIELSNGEPVNPHRIDPTHIAELEKEADVQHWVRFDLPKGDDNVDADPKDADLFLHVTSETRHASRKDDDGCFQGESWTSTRMTTVLAVTRKISKIFGIRKGQSMGFTCSRSFAAPTGPHCR